MSEEFHCARGPDNWSIVYSEVTEYPVRSGLIGYYLDQAAKCYGHGLYLATMIFAAEALETRLRELNPTQENLQDSISGSSLGVRNGNQQKARMVFALRHLHAHPPPWLRPFTRSLVEDCRRDWGVNVPRPPEIAELTRAAARHSGGASTTLPQVFSRPEVAKKVISEAIRLLKALRTPTNRT